MAPLADYTAADAYFDVALEYAAIRNACAVFDLSPMTKHLITGRDALPFLNRLVTRDVGQDQAGTVGYCVWCDDDGQVIDDGTIFHLREGDVSPVLAGAAARLAAALGAMASMSSIVEDTHDVAGLALQGPTSCAVLKAHRLQRHRDASTPFGIAYFPFAGTRADGLAHRLHRRSGLRAVDRPDRARSRCGTRLFEKGANHGIRADGHACAGDGRIEAGFIQAHVDFLPADQAIRLDRSRSPFELDLARLVDFSKPNFNGRRALLEEQRRGSRYRLVRLDIEGNKPARSSYIYDSPRNGNVVGTVTSAEWSPSAKANIALASMHMPWGRPADELWAEIYYQRELKWSRVMARCRVVAGAFFDPPRRRATPAADF